MQDLTTLDPQQKTLHLDIISKKVLFRIDFTLRINNVVYISGWSTTNFSIETINSEGACILNYHVRKDVDNFLRSNGYEIKDKCGFNIKLQNHKHRCIEMSIKFVQSDIIFFFQTEINRKITPLIQNINMLNNLFDQDDVLIIRNEIDSLRSVIDETSRLYVDVCKAYKLLTEQTYIFFWQGWFINRRNSRFYYSSNGDDLIELKDIKYYYRQDIIDVFGEVLGSSQQGHGFIACFKSKTINNKYFVEVDENLIELPCNVSVEQITSYNKILDILITRKAQYLQIIDQLKLVHEYIQIIHNDYNQMKHSIPPIVLIDSNENQKIKYSIIIPVYGNTKFVENQFISFDDVQVKNEAEIIYVLDDPRIIQEFNLKILHLQKIYKVSCKCICSTLNRGYSCSNNLGANIAIGQYLIFMNSDVFPLHKGWLSQIVSQLEKDSNCGAVGVKLLYADNSLQHAGMAFQFNDQFNFWTNIHPNSGIESHLLKCKKSHKVPATTGACLCIRMNDFKEINGWCEDYVIGDFEDSDFCFRIMQLGKYIYLDTDVEMVHLERQSYKFYGNDLFRQNLTILNGITHQRKWKDTLTKSFSE